MKKRVSKVISIVLIFAMLFTYNFTGVFAVESNATETIGTYEVATLVTVPEGYTGIYTKADLDAVRNNLGGKYILMNDIIFTASDFAKGGAYYNNGKGWIPIGDYDNAFKGVLDGNGYAIKNLKMESAAEYSGLVAVASGTIKNLGMENSDIKGSDVVGAIVGLISLYGGVENCYNTGSVSASQDDNVQVGGIVGRSSIGDVYNCYNSGKITGKSNTHLAEVGGIVGNNSRAIKNCYNTGVVTASAPNSGAYAGGIAGDTMTNVITDCYNTAAITASGNSIYSGGICGSNGTKMKNCHNTGKITGTATTSAHVGGIAGQNTVDMANCYNLGNVIATAQNSAVYAGGIAGSHSYDTMEECYNKGIVTATSDSSIVYTGGITGYSSYEGCIVDCYNAVNVVGTSNESRVFIGGILGESSTGGSIVKICYNTGDVKGISNAEKASYGSTSYVNAGGIVGENGYSNNIIENSYNMGEIVAHSSTSNIVYVGGIVANNDIGTTEVENSYNIGEIISSYDKYIGGIIGCGDEEDVTVTNAYYYKYCCGTKTSTIYGTALSFTELKSKVNYKGFDFDTLWTMSSNRNYPLPVLKDVQLDDTTSASVSLTKSVELTKGDTVALAVTFNNPLITEIVDWTTSNKNVAAVDAFGNVKAIGTGKATITAKTLYGNAAMTCEVEVTAPTLFEKEEKIRVAGRNRYDTSTDAADSLKISLGIEKFEAIIVADGENFADALAGSYLAKVKEAPIIVVGKDDTSEDQVKKYVKDNLKTGGTVYILGGTGAVSQRFENGVKAYKDFTVDRVWGSDRYKTNLEILKRAGVKAEDILICSGSGFADSLSASAVGKPILLVDDKLNTEQKAYLNTLSTQKMYIIGGSGAVNTVVEKEIRSYGTIKRVYGQNRFTTSTAVAEEFFDKKEIEAIVLAYGLNFPDGLSGGPLALSLDAPLILVTTEDTAAAVTYMKNVGDVNVATLGGTALISDKAVNTIAK